MLKIFNELWQFRVFNWWVEDTDQKQSINNCGSLAKIIKCRRNWSSSSPQICLKKTWTAQIYPSQSMGTWIRPVPPAPHRITRPCNTITSVHPWPTVRYFCQTLVSHCLYRFHIYNQVLSMTNIRYNYLCRMEFRSYYLQQASMRRCINN